jgi:hypothetical protein
MAQQVNGGQPGRLAVMAMMRSCYPLLMAKSNN